ncbi:MAG: transcription termination/antitermination protein NusA [Deltaproteobacteria bacterium]|nr:transcription termination/antitermination protein NusA [Deltaproteobacteria bacterium]
MLSELDRVLEEIRKDKGIDKEVLINALETALVKAALNKYGHSLDIEAHYNSDLGEIELFQFKTVCDATENIIKEIGLEEALRIDPDAEIGDEIGVKMDTSQFGRIAAQTAKQVIMQNIREAERENIFSDYKDKKGELVTGYVHRFEKGSLIVLLGKYEALLPSQEQIPGEMFSMRDRVKGYVLDVRKNAKGPQILLSRTHPGFLLKLFELEVPEVSEGVVKIHNVAREPGQRAKIAVESNDSRVDPVGACVGNRGSRVQNIVHELHGERIDIIPWTDDQAKFVCSALSPAEISEIILDEDSQSMEIIVDDSQLSLAIGKKGQNVRLAAKLTNWKIDIRSKTKYDESSKKNVTQLQRIPDIDEVGAEKLCNEDYPTIEAVTQADTGELAGILGVDQEQVEAIKMQARLLLESPPAEERAADEADGEEPVEEAEVAESAEEANGEEPVEEAEVAESAEEVDGEEPAEEVGGAGVSSDEVTEAEDPVESSEKDPED